MSSGTEEPLQDGVESGDDDGYMLTLRFKERPLIWIAIAVLALFVVVEGLAILTMRSSSSSQFPEPGDFHDPNEMGRSGSQGFTPKGGSEAGGSAVPGSDKSTPVQKEGALVASTGMNSVEIVTGDEAVSRVNAYLKDAGLSAADADELLNVITSMNTSLAALDASLAKGDVGLEVYTSSVQQEQENARLGILRILGWQKSSILLESLRGPGTAK